jgi:hypothetical protein
LPGRCLFRIRFRHVRTINTAANECNPKSGEERSRIGDNSPIADPSQKPRLRRVEILNPNQHILTGVRMKSYDLGLELENASPLPASVSRLNESIDRRRFFRQAGMLGAGAAASTMILGTKPANAATAWSSQAANQYKDSAAEIFTAFLIAEGLATTFYYNGLIGSVIEDPNLAGPGGTATSVSSSGNEGNVDYLRAALTEEIDHANYFRLQLTGSASAAGAGKDPYQTFYFPTGTFDNLTNFLAILNALENAFIGAYLTVIQEFAVKSANAHVGVWDTPADRKYSSADFQLYAKVAASILGVETEHRVLGRVISNSNPANNLAYQQLDGLQSIYNGPNSAVAALTPFLTPSTGPGYSLTTANVNFKQVSVPVSGSYPVS